MALAADMYQVMSDRDDDVLWQQAHEGDSDAFGLLFERHARAIYAYCFHRTADRGLAEDLTSVTFLEAWRRRDVSLPHGKVLPWLFGIASNVIRNQRRKLRRHTAALERLAPSSAQADFADDVAGRVDAEEQMRRVLGELDCLSRGERDVFALSIWHGLSPSDTAFALGIPVATVRTRLFRTRKRLSSRLGVQESEETEAAFERMEGSHAGSDA